MASCAAGAGILSSVVPVRYALAIVMLVSSQSSLRSHLSVGAWALKGTCSMSVLGRVLALFFALIIKVAANPITTSTITPPTTGLFIEKYYIFSILQYWMI